MREAELVRAVNRAMMFKWLRKHAMRLPAGPLTQQQEQDIAECFQMLDEDASGTLEVAELVKAFRMLGLKADQSSVRAMLKQVQGDARQELRQHEFRALMAHSLATGSGNANQQSMEVNNNGMPFEEIARATKRKQNLQKVMAGGQQRQQYIEKTAVPSEGSRSIKTTPMFKTASKKQRAVTSVVAGTGGHRVVNTRAIPEVDLDNEPGASQTLEMRAAELIRQNMAVPWNRTPHTAPAWKHSRSLCDL